jgi:hypothetical protein
MAHFAQIGENNKVINVIVVDNMVLFDEENATYDERLGIAFCNSLIPGKWVQTSYNNNIRKNYAGIGYTWDEGRDAFIPPKPFESWVLDEDTCTWESPSPRPDSVADDVYLRWNEETLQWEEIKIALVADVSVQTTSSSMTAKTLSSVEMSHLNTIDLTILSTTDIQSLSTTGI